MMDFWETLAEANRLNRRAVEIYHERKALPWWQWRKRRDLWDEGYCLHMVAQHRIRVAERDISAR